MKINNDEAFAEMLKIFLSFDGHSPSNQADEWRRLEGYVIKLVESGWTRRCVYNIVRDVERKHANSMPEESADAIGNYMTGLIGQVAVGYIVRLPGEPSDVNEHAHYVRKQQWLKQQ